MTMRTVFHIRKKNMNEWFKLLVAQSGHKKLTWKGPREGHASKYLQVTYRRLSHDRLK